MTTYEDFRPPKGWTQTPELLDALWETARAGGGDPVNHDYKPYPIDYGGSSIAWVRGAVPKLAAIALLLVLERERKQARDGSYDEYLKSDSWRIRREWALELANNRCELCNKPNRLHVHHRTYERLYNELPRDLTVLCADCHAKHHDKAPGP